MVVLCCTLSAAVGPSGLYTAFWQSARLSRLSSISPVGRLVRRHSRPVNEALYPPIFSAPDFVVHGITLCAGSPF